jgi:hypothetical protein
MVEEECNIQMETVSKVNGQMTKPTDLVYTYIEMEQSTKDTG